ncbi:MAG TPA: DoxX family protein [Pseudomonadales bacterium]|nr:DoxX family protein [Pseudomonadales bacterium]
MKKIFTPGNNAPLTSAGLLVLRCFFGFGMLFLHGWGKLSTFSKTAADFPDPLGIGHSGSLGLTVFAEVVAAALLGLGLFTRAAAAVLAIEMAVAFTMVHKMAFSGQMSGEMAFVYFGAYFTLLLAGPGRFSLDLPMFGKGKA